MSDQRIKFPRISDCAIADVFKELSAQYGLTQVNVSALGFTSLGYVDLTDQKNQDWTALLNHDSYLILSMGCTIRGLSIAYHRGGQYPPENQSPIYDELLLRWDEKQQQNQPKVLSNKEKLEIIASLNKKLRPFEPERIVGRKFSEEDSQLLAIHHSTLGRVVTR